MKLALLLANGEPIRLVVLYRLHPKKKTGITNALFFEEFTNLVDSLVTKPGKLLMMGDFNIHWDNQQSPDTRHLMAILESVSLKQFITQTTHKLGHTIDLVVSRTDDNLIADTSVTSGLSDHNIIITVLQVEKVVSQSKMMTYRKLRDIDVNLFKDDIKASDIICSPASDYEGLCEQFDTTLIALLDRHAPEITRKVSDRHLVPWFNDFVKEAKRWKKKCERLMKASGLTVHAQMYKTAKYLSAKAIKDAKASYYNGKITKASGDQKVLFKVVDSLLHRKTSVLPSHTSSKALADDFSNFFHKKIETIRNEFDINGVQTLDDTILVPVQSSLDALQSLTEAEVLKIVKASSSASCTLDPIPTYLVKECLSELITPITNIVNLSLTTGIFPSKMKAALVRPLIKKPSLDADELRNYRPVSNLAFISKVIERAVNSRLNSYMVKNKLWEPMQSAYKPGHSTETALLCVSNDILRSLDCGKPMLLVLLDLSAAFDTVDHVKLLSRLQHRIGITGTALSWFASYLADRSQQVVIGGSLSDITLLQWGVPQGSVLGPILFSIYSSPVADIARRHGVSVHMYADDCQLYLSCDLATGIADSVSRLETCITDIRVWMTTNKLKLNDSKTEFMMLSSSQTNNTLPNVTLDIGNDTIGTSNSARNLGVIWDSSLNMLPHINRVIQLSFVQLKNIRAIKSSLTSDALEKVIHSFITSRLDYGNASLYGLPDNAVKRIQRIQNSAARVLSGTKRFDSISPVLKRLH